MGWGKLLTLVLMQDITMNANGGLGSGPNAMGYNAFTIQQQVELQNMQQAEIQDMREKRQAKKAAKAAGMPMPMPDRDLDDDVSDVLSGRGEFAIDPKMSKKDKKKMKDMAFAAMMRKDDYAATQDTETKASVMEDGTAVIPTMTYDGKQDSSEYC